MGCVTRESVFLILSCNNQNPTLRNNTFSAVSNNATQPDSLTLEVCAGNQLSFSLIIDDSAGNSLSNDIVTLSSNFQEIFPNAQVSFQQGNPATVNVTLNTTTAHTGTWLTTFFARDNVCPYVAFSGFPVIIRVKPGPTPIQDTVVTCNPYTWPVNGQTYTQSGFHAHSSGSGGCDTIWWLNLTINGDYITDDFSVCGTAFTWPVNNQSYTSSTIDTLFYTNTAGCDSLHILNLSVTNDTSHSITVNACDQYISPGGAHTWFSSGIYTDTLVSHLNCDSILTINLTVNASANDTIYDTACSAYTWQANNQTYTQPGVYQTTLLTAAGCDSNLTLILELLNDTVHTSVFACDTSFTWVEANNQTYSSSGNYTAVLTNTNGCDSVVYLDLQLKNNSQNQISISDCNPITSPGGNYTWTQSGTYIDTLVNSEGCDSLLTVHYTRLTKDTTYMEVTSCQSYTWPVNNITYQSSQQITWNQLKNTDGCDSVLILNLTVHPDYEVFDTVVACDEYNLPGTSITYTTSGNFIDHFQTVAGCDSIIHTALTINNSHEIIHDTSVCSTFTWNINNQTYNSSGTYEAQFTNSEGCDSTHVLHLTLNKVNPNTYITSGILNAIQDSASYRWYRCMPELQEIAGATNQTFTPQTSGHYAVVVTIGDCRDTSDCKRVVPAGVNHKENPISVEVFPNPNAGKFQVRLSGVSSQSGIITIKDLKGSIIMQKKPTFIHVEHIETFDVNISPGMYFITVQSDDHYTVHKVIVK